MIIIIEHNTLLMKYIHNNDNVKSDVIKNGISPDMVIMKN